MKSFNSILFFKEALPINFDLLGAELDIEIEGYQGKLCSQQMGEHPSNYDFNRFILQLIHL